jgi:hypothetical protein
MSCYPALRLLHTVHAYCCIQCTPISGHRQGCDPHRTELSKHAGGPVQLRRHPSARRSFIFTARPSLTPHFLLCLSPLPSAYLNWFTSTLCSGL